MMPPKPPVTSPKLSPKPPVEALPVLPPPPNPNDALVHVPLQQPAPSVGPDAGEQMDADAAEDAEESPRKRSKTSKNEYQVEKILQVRHFNNEVQYLIKWKG